jgi:hypothetical protein
VLWTLAFVPVGEKHYQSRKQIPFGFAGYNKLINDCLRHVRKISELRFP